MKVIIIGNIASGKSTIAAKLAADLNCPLVQIDSFRKEFGDGTPEADHKAKKAFARAVANNEDQVIELLGTGQTALYIWAELYKKKALVIAVVATMQTCLSRNKARQPFAFKIPNFGTTPQQIIQSYSYPEALKIWSQIPFLTVENPNGKPIQNTVNQIKAALHASR